MLKKTLRTLFTQMTEDASFCLNGDIFDDVVVKKFNDTSAHTTVVDHLCCDNCSKNCECGSANFNLLKYPSKKNDNNLSFLGKEMYLTARNNSWKKSSIDISNH